MSKLQKQDELLIQTFAKLDAVALGAACGIVGGLGLWLATAILLIKGGQDVGLHLSLLSQQYIGYSVTWTGSFIGAAYGLMTGFIIGWTFAAVRNLSVAVYLHAVRLWSQLSSDHFLDRFDS
jgi:hypothetical protein